MELPLVLFLTAGSVLGVQVGVRLARRFRGPRIRRLFAGVMLLGMTVIVWDLGRRLLGRRRGGRRWRRCSLTGSQGLTRACSAEQPYRTTDEGGTVLGFAC